MGEEAAADLISESVFYISMGTNDYIHYYLRNVSNVQSLYLPWRFNRFLAKAMKREIKVIQSGVFLKEFFYTLYKKKVWVSNLAQ